MKTNKYILPVALASLTLFTQSVQADLVQDNGRSHKLTVTLKAYYEGGENVTEKNNGDVKFSQKILTRKISNKEILQGLVNEGVIAGIKGWSLILVTNSDAEVVGVYIDKKNNIPINVSAYFNAGAESSIQAYKGNYNAKKDLETSTGESRALGGVMFDIDGVMVDARGILTQTTEFSSGTDHNDEFIKNAKFTDLTGEVFINSGDEKMAQLLINPEENKGLVTGHVKAAKGKKFTYNNPN